MRSRRILALAGSVALAALASGCSPVVRHHGYTPLPEELAELLPTRGLGIIPRVEEAKSSRGGRVLRALGSGNGKVVNGLPREVVKDSPFPSIGGEAFRLLYSSLTFGWGDAAHRTVLVTSTAPREGKTLVATNLAVTFAREGARADLLHARARALQHGARVRTAQQRLAGHVRGGTPQPAVAQHRVDPVAGRGERGRHALEGVEATEERGRVGRGRAGGRRRRRRT